MVRTTVAGLTGRTRPEGGEEVPAMMDELMGALGGGGNGGIEDLLGGVLGSGADTASGQKAAGLGLEAILGGMAQNAQSKKGAAELFNALDSAHRAPLLF